jgi:hypothetical protein
MLGSRARPWQARRVGRGARLLVGALVLALCAPVLDPQVQLYWRDTQRFFHPFKLAMAERLRRGELPLWDRWTEAGVSVLGQLTPGLWHPATLLYLALPFPLAFKLNHLIALPLAAAGAFLLAGRVGAQGWTAAIAAVTFAGSGFLCSMAAGNLPFALGQATIPLAVWAVLRFTDAPAPGRLLVAGLLLGSCGLAGEPQSMLLAGLIAAGFALPARGWRAAPRAIGLLALCGLLGVLFSAPATFPAAERLRLGEARRLEQSEGAFSLDARRLPGLLLPWAFDDSPELSPAGAPDTPYSEYFSGQPHVAFAGSIAAGAPAVALAAWGGAGLLLGALLLLLAALGPATPVQWLAVHLIPGYGLFRYPEKLVGPATLLLALAAAAGAQRMLAADGRAARRAMGSAAALAAVLLALWAAFALGRGAIASWLIGHGRVHAQAAAPIFLSALSRSLLVEAALAAALAIAAALQRGRAPAAAAICAASALLCGEGQLVTAPRELLESRPPLAELLTQRAGQSEGAWRIESDTEQSLVLPGLDARLRRAAWSAQALAPRTNAVQRIESVSGYGSLNDDRYLLAQARAPEAFRAVLGVRFVVRMPWERPPEGGFRQGPYGMWIRERQTLPRAFLVARAFHGAAPVRALSDPAFDPAREALTSGKELTEPGPPGEAQLERFSPERMRVTVRAPGPRLLVISEHFDPGWRAAVDGAPAPVVRADLCALGVELPEGAREVVLKFVPRGLWPGAAAFALALLLLGGLSARRYRSAAAR